MSDNHPDSADSVPVSAAARIDAVCDEFELAWKAGQRPRIEDYLGKTTNAEQSDLLRELIKLDLEYRHTNGQPASPKEYKQRFPDHTAAVDAAFDQVAAILDGNSEKGVRASVSTIAFSQSDGESAMPAGRKSAMPVELPLPDRIGRYKVIRKVGEGTYGIVYLAHDEVTDGPVAIKVPSPRLLATKRAREEFLHELRTVRRVQHRGIVIVHDFGEEPDGLCYIVYEYIDGMTLAKRMEQGRISFADAASIVEQVAVALYHAHGENLYHRDIKPANILLDKKGQPRIVDFGLAVREEELAYEKGRRAGTYSYMSPEQVRRQWFDGRSDIFSLGVVLYELLCGRRPFVGETRNELFEQIKHREARPPRQFNASIPVELERICLKALCKDVNDRYTTAKDMAEELSRAIGAMKTRDRDRDTPIDLHEIERRMASADEEELQRLLRILEKNSDPACIPLVFRCVVHASERVRGQARKTMHSLGWDKVCGAAEGLARVGDTADLSVLLDGLAAFEAHPQIVALLDRLVLLLKGDLRNRAILLLERKRLGLELNAVAELFREIYSPYRIEKVLGQGLFTATYLAHVDDADLRVAVRVLRPEFVGQPNVRAHFLDLGKSALHLVHENLALTREARAFPERSIYFVIRDYVDGLTLQQLLEGGKRFAPEQVLRILRQLVWALGAVHRRGMSHGGVKPSNIFLCEEDRVILGDPALSVQGIGVALERLSYDYRYAAPETLHGAER